MITLFIWTVIATNGHYDVRDWRALAEFETPVLCEQAALSMNIQSRHRCLKTK